jgi:hypothetical protein
VLKIPCFCVISDGTIPVPSATLSGVECQYQYSSGAKHRFGSATKS